MLRPTRKKLGFTIVELLIVIVLIGILATIGTISWKGIRERADSTKITNSLTAYVNAFVMYGSQEGHYPPTPASNNNYCLGKSSVPAAKAQELLPSLNLPSTIMGEAARYCGMFDTDNPDRDSVWAAYPPLDEALGTIARVDDSLQSEEEGYLLEKHYGGIFASYTETTAGSGIYTIIINAIYRSGDTCPSGITGSQGAGEHELGSEDLPIKMCRYLLDKQYPVTTTGVSWPPY